MDQFNITENVDTLFHSLENFTQKEGVIGKPVTQGNKTFMPVISVTVGYGGGNATMGKGQQSGNQGSYSSSGTSSVSSGTGALGLGAKLSTDAIIIVDDQNQNVQMLPMSASGASQIAEKLPQILQGINQNKQSGQSQSAGQ